MAKHLKNKKTGELVKVSKTEAKELHATGKWEYIPKSEYQRKIYLLEDIPTEPIIPYRGESDDTTDSI